MLKNMRAIGALLGAILFGTGMAIAQDRYCGSLIAKAHGYQHGYRDGLRQGRVDQSSREEHNFKTQGYKRADADYEKYMGERDDFQDGISRRI